MDRQGLLSDLILASIVEYRSIPFLKERVRSAGGGFLRGRVEFALEALDIRR